MQIIEQAKFPYSPLAIALEKQTEKQVGALKSQDFFNKKDELKQFKAVFPKNMLNDLIINNLKEIIKLQDIIKTDGLYYKTKRRIIYNFSDYALPIVF